MLRPLKKVCSCLSPDFRNTYVTDSVNLSYHSFLIYRIFSQNIDSRRRSSGGGSVGGVVSREQG